MRKTLSTLVFFFSVLSGLAHADIATWANLGAWTVVGDTDRKACWAKIRYPDGVEMSVAFSADRQTHWVINHIPARVIPNDTYIIKINGSNGVSKTLKAIGLQDGRSAAFMNIDMTTFKLLGRSETIQIQDLGRYNMTGSKAAFLTALDCYEHVNNLNN